MSAGRKTFPDPIRRTIYIQYQGLCHLCDLPLSFREMTVDHVIPLRWKGTHDIDNLAPAHTLCNRERGDMNVAHYKEKKALQKKPLGIQRLDVHL